MKMKKIFFLLFALCFLAVRPVLAADLNIDCPETAACTKSEVDPLFNIADDGYWYPGRVLTKTINLKNSSPQIREMAIRGTMTSSSILENVMQISVVGGTTTIWSGSVADFYSQDKIVMGIFNSEADLDYDFTVFMSLGADDDYQSMETVFDLTLGFWGGPIPSPTPTTTPTPGEDGEGEGEGEGAVLGAGVAAPVCSDTPPGGAPVLLSAISGVNSVTLIWSEAPDPVSYYLVAYGTLSSVYSFGNPNIGGKGTTSYTVSGLSGGMTYYFVVRAGNGCATGAFSGELTAAPTGGVVAGPARGFLPGVLGEETEGELVEPTPTGETGEGEVAGVGAKPFNFWWLFLLFILSLGFYLYFKRK